MGEEVGAPTESDAPSLFRYAELWQRATAFRGIDAPIACAIYYVAAWGLGYMAWHGMFWLGVKYDTMLLVQNVFYFLVGGVVDWLYYALLESSPVQATVGKRLLGLAVADEDGKRISFARAT